MKNDRLSKQRYDLERAYEQKKQARDRILGKEEIRAEVKKRNKERPGWQQFQQFREVNREQYEPRNGFMEDLLDWQKQVIAGKIKLPKQQLPTQAEAQQYINAYWTANPLMKRLERMAAEPERPDPEFTCMWCAEEFGDVGALEAHEEVCG